MASPLLGAGSLFAGRAAAAACRSSAAAAAAAPLALGSSSLLVSAAATSVRASVELGGVRWATSKAGGSTKNGRDSNPKYLGVKRYGGQYVEPGNIIVRQRGQRYGIVESTATVALGRDHTVYALKAGYVRFWWHAMRRKYYIEVVQSHPSEPEVSKYPIVRLADWELPSLLGLPPSTPVDPPVILRLAQWIKGLNTAQKLAAVPRGVPLIGGVHEVAWGPLPHGGKAAAAAPAVTPTAAAPAAATATA